MAKNIVNANQKKNLFDRTGKQEFATESQSELQKYTNQAKKSVINLLQFKLLVMSADYGQQKVAQPQQQKPIDNRTNVKFFFGLLTGLNLAKDSKKKKEN